MNHNDTETIIKDFLSLWQKQFSHMSRDGDAVQKGLDALSQMQEAYANIMNAKAGKTKNAKSTATSDILRNIGNEFVLLAKSHAELEERVARLESKATERRAASPKKAGAKKPAGARKRAK